MAPIASIVMPCYGHWQLTERCLASLDDVLGPTLGNEIELVLVDNGSTDETPERLEAWRERATVVSLMPNRHFAGGCNAGGFAATGDVLIFLNNDTVARPGVFEALAEEASDPTVGVAGIRLLYPDGTIQHGGFGWIRSHSGVTTAHLFHHEAGDIPEASATYDLRAVTGACFATPRELFVRLGGFDERYHEGWEDVDYCLRARELGLRVVYRGDLAILHDEGKTTGRDYRGDGNERIFVARHGEHRDDDDLFRATFGGSAQSLLSAPGGTAADGSPVRIVGRLLGFSGDATEARMVLNLAEAMQLVPAARALGTGIPSPLLTPESEQVVAAQQRWTGHFALEVLVHGRGPLPEGAFDAVHLASRDGLDAATLPTVWAGSRALAEELTAEGVEAEVLYPPLPEIERGTGGGGILAVLPAHDLELCDRIVAALDDADADVTFLQTVASPHLARLVGGLPLLPPCVDELSFAALAGGYDVLVSLDSADPFERRPLVAGLAGATPVFARGGAAEELLGSGLAVTGPDDLRTAVARALAEPTEDDAREAVLAACGAPAAAQRLAELFARKILRRASRLVAEDAQAAAARIAA